MGYELIAAVDLGSNSFRLQVGRVVEDQIYPLDSIKESVRLAGGLTSEKSLDGPSQLRALEALRRFGERLRGFDPASVRAVATNTLRVAKNAPQFLVQAEAALGFPIEVIAGREEARLIYLGVANALPDRNRQQLVVDIGGGSTEFIVGRGFETLELESIYMGCVGYSLKYFPNGLVDKAGMKAAELAARREIQAIVSQYKQAGWEVAIGSSGTAKTLVDVLEQNEYSASGITADGLAQLKAHLLRTGDVNKLQVAGLRDDRMQVLPGGLAIMSAVFKEFGLEQMMFSEGALRLGVLYDLLGRYHHHDLRDMTVRAFARRYQVDSRQAERVGATALQVYAQLNPSSLEEGNMEARYLGWVGALHEVGISVAHSSFHKHSAYILGNADMPGFSKMDQGRLARLALVQRGKLERAQESVRHEAEWDLIFSLRFSAILHRARDNMVLPEMQVKRSEKGYTLSVPSKWLADSPLTAAALEEEGRQWKMLGLDFRIKAHSE